MFKRHKHASKGQALVEFALVIILLLLLLTFIIEASRILWAWITVQNSARGAARYAITGQLEIDCTQDATHVEFPCTDARVTSIRDVARTGLTGLRTVEPPLAEFEDDYYTSIEVYGTDENGNLRQEYAGIPGQPMAVRIVHNVPIVTPLLRSIVETVPVMGQIVMNNELFGQTGGVTRGQALPPSLPSVPTAGPSPTPTPSPTITPTMTATPTNTPDPLATATGTPTETPIPICPVIFRDDVLLEDDTIIQIMGDRYIDNNQANGEHTITIYDITDNDRVLATVTIGDATGVTTHCTNGNDGYVVVTVDPLIANHFLVVESTNGTQDFIRVLPKTATATPVPTQTPIPTITPTFTPTSPPTATPLTPFILVNNGASCVSGPNVELNIIGGNWQTGETVELLWDGAPIDYLGNPFARFNVSGGTFQTPPTAPINIYGVSNGTHVLTAFYYNSSLTETATVILTVPCPGVTSTPTATPTPTLAPPDLIIDNLAVVPSGGIIEFEPVEFTAEISNIGESDVDDLFFIDVYLDPPISGVISGTTTSIDLAYSDGYTAIDQLASGASRVITFTAPLGFRDDATNPRTAYSMVDSLEDIIEEVETNNIDELTGIEVTRALQTPTPTPVTTGPGTISGINYILFNDWVPIRRAKVYLYDNTTMTVVAQTTTDENGFYVFTNVPDGTTYELISCFDIGGSTAYVGSRQNVVPSTTSAVIKNIYLTVDVACPH